MFSSVIIENGFTEGQLDEVTGVLEPAFCDEYSDITLHTILTVLAFQDAPVVLVQTKSGVTIAHFTLYFAVPIALPVLVFVLVLASPITGRAGDLT